MSKANLTRPTLGRPGMPPTAAASTRANTTASIIRARWTPSPPTLKRKAWATSRSPGGCATGASRASATGARRSRSFIVRDAPVAQPPGDLLVAQALRFKVGGDGTHRALIIEAVVFARVDAAAVG